MKYEISQRAYVDFLNTLTYQQQAVNTIEPPGSATGTPAMIASGRNYIEIKIPGVDPSTPAVYGIDGDNDNLYDEPTDGEWISLFGNLWWQLCAYLDWAALRPMTETEFEKICRGPLTPSINEFAWANSDVFNSPYTLTAAAFNSETASNSSTTQGNANYLSTDPGGSMRNGIFATANSDRTTSGASYYGVMEMSGNIWERVVCVGNVAGRSFQGNLGDGSLMNSGYANVDYWPGINGNFSSGAANTVFGGTTGVINSAGSGWRGGQFDTSDSNLRISDRELASRAGNLILSGGRGVRQAD